MLSFSKKLRCHFFDTQAGPGTVRFRGTFCMGEGYSQRSAEPSRSYSWALTASMMS